MSRFVICINNDNNRVSLIVGKVYRPLIDDEAEARSLVRIIDEDKSETDGYVYPSTILKRYQALRRRISFTDGTGRTFKRYYIERDDISSIINLQVRLAADYPFLESA